MYRSRVGHKRRVNDRLCLPPFIVPGDMRPFLLLATLYIILLAMEFTCLFCQRVCTSEGGYTKHLKACKPRRTQLRREARSHATQETQQAAFRVIELEELKRKRTQMEAEEDEEEREWLRKLHSDREVSTYSLNCCLWQAPWGITCFMMLVYTRDMFCVMITDFFTAYIL